jgi:hypothetical protein
MFGVPARTLRYWISTGRIRVVKISNGRGGYSKRIKRPETLADRIALENAFAKRPARGPCPRLPLPVQYRKAFRELTQHMEKAGGKYRKAWKPKLPAWRSQQKATQSKWKISDAEVEKKLSEIAAKIRL